MAYTAPSTGIVTSSATFAELQKGGLSAVLELVITANSTATAAPTSASLAASGSGHTLPAESDYYVVVTESNGIGETTASPASTGQAITLGQELTVTYASLQTGNISRNLYVGTSSTGPFYLAASGVTTSTTVLTAPLPSNSYAVQPPTVNTTGFTWTDANGNVVNKTLELLRACETGNFEDVYRFAAKSVDNFLRGDPVTFPAAIQKLRHAQSAIGAVSQALTDIGGLIDANAGTLTQTTDGGVGTVSATKRTWP